MAVGGWGPRFRVQAAAVIMSCVLSVMAAPAAFAVDEESPAPLVATPSPTDSPRATATPTPTPTTAPDAPVPAPTPSANPTDTASPTPVPETPTPRPTERAVAPGTPAVHPWFQAKYAELGGASGPMGKPVKDMQCQAASCWQGFEGGVLTSDGTQIVRLSTAYVATWLQWGGPDGDLGLVAGPESCFGTYCQTPFSGGVIVWVPGSGVFPVAKAWFYDAWVQRGGATGSLGLPTDGMKCQSTACYQTFVNGTLTSSTTGIVALSSEYVSTWLAGGGPDGPLGLISGTETCDGTSCTVPFQRGSLVWTPGVGVKTVTTIPFPTSPTPRISGTAELGRDLTALVGTWSPVPDSFSYRWQRNGVPITGAPYKTYRVQAADLGTTLSVAVTARKTGYTTVTRVSAGKDVAAVWPPNPQPFITGTLGVGESLTANTGTWTPQPDAFTYQWRRNGTAISGATAGTYTPTQTDAGAEISVTITASKAKFPSITQTSGPVKIPATTTVRVTEDITANTTWAPKTPTVYVITTPIAVTSGATLTVGGAATVKFAEGAGITVYGSLTASSNPATRTIPFTSLRDDATGGDTDGDTGAPVRGDWPGLKVGAGGTLTLTEGVRVAYASTGITAEDAASLTVNSSTVDGGIVSRAAHGAVTLTRNVVTTGDVRVSTPSGPAYVSAVRITDNTLQNGSIEVSTGNDLASLEVTRNVISTAPDRFAMSISSVRLAPRNLTGNTVTGDNPTPFRFSGTLRENWTIPTTGPGVALGSLTVGAGYTLTVPAGAAVKLGWGVELTVRGSLVAKGTTTAPATLTSLYDDSVGGDALTDGTATDPSRLPWRGVVVSAGGSVTLENARLTYTSVGLTGTEAGLISVTSSAIDGGIQSSNARGAVVIDSSAIGGDVLVGRPDGFDYAFAVTVTQNTLSRGYIYVTSQNNTPGAPPIVVSGNMSANASFVRITDTQLRPRNLTGNTGAGGATLRLLVGGTLVEDWTLPTAAGSTGFDALTVAPGATLTVPAGGTVELAAEVVLRVEGALVTQGTAAKPVLVTALYKDSASQWWDRIEAVNGGRLSIEGTTFEKGFGVQGYRAGPVRIAASNITRGGFQSIDARGPVVVTGTTTPGVTVQRPDGAEFAVPVTVSDNTTSAPIRIESRNTTSGAPPIEVTGNRITSSGESPALQVLDPQLRPSKLIGNTFLGTGRQVIFLDGTLVENWTLPTTGPQLVFNSFTIAPGVTVTAPAGSLVKFQNAGVLVVGGSFVSRGTAAAPVTLTSVLDDGVRTPGPDAWKGIQVLPGGTVTGPNLIVKYATSGSSR